MLARQDIVVLGEPSELRLTAREDFAAAAPDDGVVGSTGPDHPHDGFWRRAAGNQGLTLEMLPWVHTDDGERIRFYWNSGVFAYRRASGWARHT